MDSRHWVNGIVVVRSVIVPLVVVVVVWHLVCKQRSSTTLIKKTAAGEQEQQLPLLLSPIEPVSAFRRLPQHVHNESCWLCANNFYPSPPSCSLQAKHICLAQSKVIHFGCCSCCANKTTLARGVPARVCVPAGVCVCGWEHDSLLL